MLPILNQSLWRDEAFSALLAKKHIFEVIKLSMQDTSPPFYYILLHYWVTMFGNGEVAIRMMSLLFHLFTVIVVFFIARKIIRSSLSGQILIALVTLLNPFLLQYAFEARTYGLLTFLSATALYLVISKKYITAGIALTLAIFAHNFAVFTFLVFAIWWLFINRTKLQFSSFLKLVGFPLSAMLLWGWVIWIQWSKFAHGFWISKPTIHTLFRSFELFSSGEISYPIRFTLYLFSVMFFVIASLAWIRKYKSKNNNIVLLIFSLIFIPPLITFFFSLFFTPIYYERYLILTAPMLILFVSYSLKRLLRINAVTKTILYGFIAIYITLLVTACMQIVSKSTKPAINFGVREILSRAQENDVIVPESTLNFLETKYYVGKSEKNIPVYAYSPDGKIPFYIGGILYEPQDIIQKMPRDRRVWQIKSDGQYGLLKL